MSNDVFQRLPPAWHGFAAAHPKALGIRARATGWPELDAILGGGWPEGRIVGVRGSRADLHKFLGEAAARVEGTVDRVTYLPLDTLSHEARDGILAKGGTLIVDDVTSSTETPHDGLAKRLLSLAIRRITSVLGRTKGVLIVGRAPDQKTQIEDVLRHCASIQLEVHRGEDGTWNVRTVKNKVVTPFQRAVLGSVDDADVMAWVLRSYPEGGDGQFVLRAPHAGGIAGSIMDSLKAHFLRRPFVHDIGGILREAAGDAAVSIEQQERAAAIWADHGAAILRELYRRHDGGRKRYDGDWDSLRAVLTDLGAV